MGNVFHTGVLQKRLGRIQLIIGKIALISTMYYLIQLQMLDLESIES